MAAELATREVTLGEQENARSQSISDPVEPSADRVAELEARHAELEQQTTNTRQMADEVAAAKAAFEAEQAETFRELEDRRNQLAALEAAQRDQASDIERKSADLQAAREDLQQRGELEARQAALEARLQAESADQGKQAQLTAQGEALTAAQDEVERERAELLAQREELGRQRLQLAELDARRAELEQLDGATHHAVEELAVARASFEAGQADALRELEARRDELDVFEATQREQAAATERTAAELQATREALQRRTDELDSRESALAEQSLPRLVEDEVPSHLVTEPHSPRGSPRLKSRASASSYWPIAKSSIVCGYDRLSDWMPNPTNCRGSASSWTPNGMPGMAAGRTAEPQPAAGAGI